MERVTSPPLARRSLPLMETHLLDPEAVLANEAFPKGSPRPDYFKYPDQTQTQAGRPACVIASFSFLDDLENWVRARKIHLLSAYFS